MSYKVAIYAICKNEDQFVEKWIESVKEADYIVVLDTGSTDATLKHIQGYCAQIGIYDKLITDTQVFDPWRFDTPRNAALDLCPEDTDIYVSIDLDEVFEPGWCKILKDRWTPTTQRATYKYTWSHLSDGSDGRVFGYNKIHSKGWRWKYPVHELLVNVETGSNLYDHKYGLYLFNDIHLHHYPDRKKSRGNYLPLLELRKKEDLAEEHKDYYGRIYLGHEYYYRGYYKKCIDELQSILVEFPDKEALNEASCYLFMGDAFKELGDKTNAQLSYMKAIEIEPTYREPYLNLAQLFLKYNEYEDAIFYAKKGLKESHRHFTWLERDTSWSYQPYDILSLAYYYNGDKLTSLAYATKAAHLEPTNKRLQNNIDQILKTMSTADFC